MDIKDEKSFDELAVECYKKFDVCPIMSIGRKTPAHCTESCAWFDTELKECAVSRINGNLKLLKDIKDR